MSSQDTRSLIAQAIDHFTDEVPALKNLKLVIRLELRTHGGDVPIWRVELPGPKITKDPAADARVDVSVGRRDQARGAGRAETDGPRPATRLGGLHRRLPASSGFGVPSTPSALRPWQPPVRIA
jgi:hypothetical protein